MIEAAINKILGLARPEILEVGGREYSSKAILPVKDPAPAPLGVETLTGLIDYIEANRDEIAFENCLIHIENYHCVSLISKLEGAFIERDKYVQASVDRREQNFGNDLDIETFIIWMQASFLDVGDRAKILAFVGNIHDGQIANFSDDGVTQSVNVKTGITKVEVASVPNPVSLTPYRTFIDAVQPPSNFVFRLKSGSGSERPKAALFEADGGKWKSDAVQNIKKYLVDELARIQVDIPVIA